MLYIENSPSVLIIFRKDRNGILSTSFLFLQIFHCAPNFNIIIFFKSKALHYNIPSGGYLVGPKNTLLLVAETKFESCQKFLQRRELLSIYIPLIQKFLLVWKQLPQLPTEGSSFALIKLKV